MERLADNKSNLEATSREYLKNLLYLARELKNPGDFIFSSSLHS